MPLKFKETSISGLYIVEPIVFQDERGFFLEFFKESDFIKNGIKAKFVQDNHSKSKKWVLRGLHFQDLPYPQGKLIKCIKGEIFDVAIDLRKGSPTFGQWFGIRLSEENKLMLWIPPGFAHGFLTLSDEAEIIYKVSESEYSPNHDRTLRWDDPDIGINWPLPENVKPILSPKDENAPFLKELTIKFNFEEQGE